MSSTSPPTALHFLLLMFSGWVNRQQQQVIDYLMEENRVLREQLGGRRLRLTDYVAFYVHAHNTQIPHSVFAGQTPGGIYFGTGDGTPVELAAKREVARDARVEANRRKACDACTGHRARSSLPVAVAA